VRAYAVVFRLEVSGNRAREQSTPGVCGRAFSLRSQSAGAHPNHERGTFSKKKQKSKGAGGESTQ